MRASYNDGAIVMVYGVISLIITNIETVLTINWIAISISSQLLFPI